MPDNDKEKFLIWKRDKVEPGIEQGGKHSHEDKRYEKGTGNRKTEHEGPNSEKKTELLVGPLYKIATALEGELFDTRGKGNNKDLSKKGFAQTFHGKVGDAELLSASANLTEAKARAVIGKLKAEASVVHAELDVGSELMKLLDIAAPPKKAGPTPPPPAAPMAARLGDPVAHGSLLAPGRGSPDVLIGGLAAWRVALDIHFCPCPGGAPHGAGTLAPGEPRVLINGAPAARAGDCLIEAPGGPNMILLGCQNVLIGTLAAAPSAPVPAPKARQTKVELQSIAKTDLMVAEGDLQLFGEADLKNGKVVIEGQAGGMIALAKGELPIKVMFTPPGSEYHIGLGITLEGSLISAGAEAGGGLKITPGAIGWDGGAKVGWGLGGVGIKFSFEATK